MTLTELETLEALHAAGDIDPFPVTAKALREALESLRVARSDVACLWKERDEVRAEVERLRSAISRFVAQYPWQDGPEIQELKALKERE